MKTRYINLCKTARKCLLEYKKKNIPIDLVINIINSICVIEIR